MLFFICNHGNTCALFVEYGEKDSSAVDYSDISELADDDDEAKYRAAMGMMYVPAPSIRSEEDYDADEEDDEKDKKEDSELMPPPAIPPLKTEEKFDGKEERMESDISCNVDHGGDKSGEVPEKIFYTPSFVLFLKNLESPWKWVFDFKACNSCNSFFLFLATSFIGVTI